MRHPRYKSIIEPDAHPKNSLFLNPKRKEFWRTDMEAVLHKEADQRKARQKVSEPGNFLSPYDKSPISPTKTPKFSCS
jgi:hypothetical protein